MKLPVRESRMKKKWKDEMYKWGRRSRAGREYWAGDIWWDIPCNWVTISWQIKTNGDGENGDTNTAALPGAGALR